MACVLQGCTDICVLLYRDFDDLIFDSVSASECGLALADCGRRDFLHIEPFCRGDDSSFKAGEKNAAFQITPEAWKEKCMICD